MFSPNPRGATSKRNSRCCMFMPPFHGSTVLEGEQAAFYPKNESSARL
jgi:hypothetical protein